MLFFYFVISPRYFRAASVDHGEILHHGRKSLVFYNAGPKVWWVLLQRISGARNMQNLAQFQTTSNFDGEYLWNGWRYSKSDMYLIYHDSFCVWRKKCGELRSTNCGGLEAKSNPPKSTLIDHISSPRGCCAANFYTWQVLLAHTPSRIWVPLTIFSRGLKIHQMHVYNFGAKGLVLWNIAMWCAAMKGW